MLRIKIPLIDPAKLAFTDPQNHAMPQPPHGVAVEQDSEAVLLFDSEEEAVDYADHVEEMAVATSKRSPERSIMRDLASAIYNSEIIRNYLFRRRAITL